MNSNLDLYSLKRRNICTRSNLISGKRFKKNFFCSNIYEVISQRKWRTSYEWLYIWWGTNRSRYAEWVKHMMSKHSAILNLLCNLYRWNPVHTEYELAQLGTETKKNTMWFMLLENKSINLQINYICNMLHRYNGTLFNK